LQISVPTSSLSAETLHASHVIMGLIDPGTDPDRVMVLMRGAMHDRQL
jgi:hypothetical protein